MDDSRQSGQRGRRREVVNAFGALLLLAASCLASACSGSTSFTLEFPEGVDLGELWLIEDVNCFTCGTGEEYLGRATGAYEIELPARHWYVSLRMLAGLGEIILGESDVRDEDLEVLSAMNLRSIGLRGTEITGAGLQHLQPHDDWIFVDLRDCTSLETRHLARFRGWKRSTITVASRDQPADPTSRADSIILVEARKYICDGQPESICQTQIR